MHTHTSIQTRVILFCEYVHCHNQRQTRSDRDLRQNRSKRPPHQTKYIKGATSLEKNCSKGHIIRVDNK